MDSILLSVKKMIGFAPEYTEFDTDLIMHINTVLALLVQMGVGNKMLIEDTEAKWSKFLEGCPHELEMVKSYVYMKVRMIFDPPTTGSVKEAMTKAIDELEWRLNVGAETPVHP